MCCICLIEDNKNYITLKCSHKLHKFCLKELLEYSNKCPMCRQRIFKEHVCNCFFCNIYAVRPYSLQFHSSY
jgi:hypothetical protein